MGKTRQVSHRQSRARHDQFGDWNELPPPEPAAPVAAPSHDAPTYESISSDWEHDCIHWRGLVLRGHYAHWCPNWDDLPMDETCPEWPCGCEMRDIDDGNDANH